MFLLPGSFPAAAFSAGQDNDQQDCVRGENRGDNHQCGNGCLAFSLRHLEERASVAGFENDEASVALALRRDQGAFGGNKENGTV